jgi:hypothetical protein
MKQYKDDEDREVQHAEITITVAFETDAETDNRDRMEHALRKLRLMDFPAGWELRPGLSVSDVVLTETETIAEARLRQEGEAESRAEARLDEQRERYFDERGHF